MHEMSITRSVLEAVRREMEKSGLKRLNSVTLRIGELAAVEPEALRFCFEACLRGTPLEGAALVIEESALTGRCLECGQVFRITAFESSCPGCGSPSTERSGGAELDLVSMDGS